MNIRDIFDRTKNGVTYFIWKWRHKLFPRKKSAHKEPAHLSKGTVLPLDEDGDRPPPQRAAHR